MIILYDNNGTPVIDDAGNFVLIDSLEKVKQIVYNVLTTRKGEDILNPDYGLDIETLKSTPNISSNLARAIIADAFNPINIIGISELNSLSVRVEGNEIFIEISLTTDSGEVLQEQTLLEV
jgi:uncharacterized protein (UPF0371 family)